MKNNESFNSLISPNDTTKYVMKAKRKSTPTVILLSPTNIDSNTEKPEITFRFGKLFSLE